MLTFTPGRTDLPPVWNLTVSNVWLAWRECRGPVRVEGHVERGGSADSANDSLQMARAVEAELVRKGIEAKAVNSVGRGTVYPLDGVPLTDGKNRRVEIYLLPPR